MFRYEQLAIHVHSLTSNERWNTKSQNSNLNTRSFIIVQHNVIYTQASFYILELLTQVVDNRR
jgi:hypothetical protein